MCAATSGARSLAPPAASASGHAWPTALAAHPAPRGSPSGAHQSKAARSVHLGAAELRELGRRLRERLAAEAVQA